MKQKFTLLFIVLAFCGALSNKAISQVIFSEDFESGSIPGTWAVTGTATNTFCPTITQWAAQQNLLPVCAASNPQPNAQSGVWYADFNSSTINDEDTGLLITPALNLSVPGATYKVSFWIYYDQLFFGPAVGDSLQVFAGPDVNGPAGNILLKTIAPHDSSITGWRQVVLTLPGTLTGTSNHIMFKAKRGTNAFATNGDMQIDNVVVAQYLRCTGKPSSGVVGPDSKCAGVPFTITDTSNSTYTTGISYQWQQRTSGIGFFNDVPFQTTQTYNGSVGISTDFRILTTCAYSHQVDTSATYTMNVSPFYNCYCGPAVNSDINTFTYGNTFGQPTIDSVTIPTTTLNNLTDTAVITMNGTTYNRYMAYPDSGNTTGTLQVGARYSIVSNLGGPAYTVAWIDFDHSGTFDASEAVTNFVKTSSSNFVVIGSFTVPSTAKTGKTGFRIRTANSSIGSGSGCSVLTETAGGGETQDYIVNIIAPPYNDLTSYAVYQPSTGSVACANTCVTVSAVVQNIGASAQSNYIVASTYSGPASGTIYTVRGATVNPFKFDTVTIGCVAFPLPGVYTVKTYTALGNDANRVNDTSITTITITAPPTLPAVASKNACKYDSVVLNVTPEAGTTHYWYNGPSGGSVLFAGDSIKIDSIKNSTTFFVTSVTTGAPASLSTVTGISTSSFKLASGVMFDDSAAVNLTVDSFGARFGDTGLQAVGVYYRTSSYKGFELSAGSWVFLGSTAVRVTDTTAIYNVNVFHPIAMTAGDKFAFYLNYRAGVSSGSGMFQDANMRIRVIANTGSGQRTAFTDTVRNVLFNGTVYYHTGGTSCESNRVPITATVGAPPTVDIHNFSGTYCKNSTSLILDAKNPGAKYMWSTGDTTQKITVTTTGYYSVCVTGNCTVCDTLYDSVLAVPVVTGISYTRVGNTYAFTPSGIQNVVGYYWNFGDGYTSTLKNPTHTYASAGVYNVTLQVSNSCGAVSVNLLTPTAINTPSSKADAVNIYPNPASTVITISGIGNLDYSGFTIINSVGEVVYKATSLHAGMTTEKIDVSKLVPGNYILHIDTNDGPISRLFEVIR